MEGCHQVTLLYFFFYCCWLRLSSTPLLNGRCWNKLKYPFYPCQKCIHEEHWLFNAGQMWWFLWKYVFCVEGKWKLRLGCSSSHFWRGRGWGLCICVAFMSMKASILIGVRVCHYAKADSQAYIWARMLSCNLLNLETQLTGKMSFFGLQRFRFCLLWYVWKRMARKVLIISHSMFHSEKKLDFILKSIWNCYGYVARADKISFVSYSPIKTNFWIIKCTDVFATLDRKLYDYKRCFLLACQAMQPWWMSVIYSASRVDTCINGSQ